MPLKSYIAPTDRRRLYYFDDFGGGNYDNRAWAFGSVGSGSVAKLAALAGQVIVTVGATSGNESYIIGGANFNYNNGLIDCSWRAKSENTANCTLQLGLQIDGNNSIMLMSDSADGTNWIGQCINGGSSSRGYASLAVDTNWHVFKMVITGSSVQFFVDSTLVTTVSANIPSGDLSLIAYGHRYSGGSGTRSFLVDWCEAVGSRTS
jgi:hypothetical protein